MNDSGDLLSGVREMVCGGRIISEVRFGDGNFTEVGGGRARRGSTTVPDDMHIVVRSAIRRHVDSFVGEDDAFSISFGLDFHNIRVISGMSVVCKGAKDIIEFQDGNTKKWSRLIENKNK